MSPCLLGAWAARRIAAPNQPQELCRPEWHDRYRDLARAHPIGISLLAPRRGDVVAVTVRVLRRGGGAGDHRPRQQQGLQGGQSVRSSRFRCPAARARRRWCATSATRRVGGPPRGDHPAPRYCDPRGRPRDRVLHQQEAGAEGDSCRRSASTSPTCSTPAPARTTPALTASASIIMIFGLLMSFPLIVGRATWRHLLAYDQGLSVALRRWPVAVGGDAASGMTRGKCMTASCWRRDLRKPFIFRCAAVARLHPRPRLQRRPLRPSGSPRTSGATRVDHPEAPRRSRSTWRTFTRNSRVVWGDRAGRRDPVTADWRRQLYSRGADADEATPA